MSAVEVNDWEGSTNIGSVLETGAEPTPAAPIPGSDPATAPPPADAKPAAPAKQPIPDPPAADGDTEAGERDGKGRFRHRAKSQSAGPGDVPRIAELTKKWRTAEETNKQLQERLEKLEKATQPPPPAVSQFVPPAPSAPNGAVPAKPVRPKFEAFETVQAWEEAVEQYEEKLLAYHEQKRTYEADQTKAKTETETAQKAAQEAFQRAQAAYNERVTAFVATKPDFQAKIQSFQTANPSFELTALAHASILLDEKGPELMYTLVHQPALLYELTLHTDGKPVSDQAVALTQRWLHARVQAVPTGSAVASPSHSTPPRPPNPVRTGAMKTGDTPPGDDSSLEEHERYFGRTKASLRR